MSEWRPDILGRGFEYMTVGHPDDYSGPVVSTVVRRRSGSGSGKAVVYVHGFSDYFLQYELGEKFNTAGYDFYAVDLRKYGRSLLPGQRMFEVRDLREYFPDIEAAVDAAGEDGNAGIALLGHSTGGLVSSLYMACRPSPSVRALMLNSPFLDWNLPWFLRRVAIPCVAVLGRFFPDMRVRQKPDDRYARSLSLRHGGEWDYDASWKPDILPDPDAGWVRAIERGQRFLLRHKVGVPVLLMHSDNTVRANDAFERFTHGDAILDVDLIAERGRRLGPDVTEVEISGGLHDLALSARDVRKLYYETMLGWLEGKI